MSVQGRRRVVTNEFLPIAANNHPQKRTKEEEEAKEGGRGATNKSLCGAGSTFFLLGFEDSIPRMMKRRSLFCDTRASPFTLVEWIHKNLSIARYVYLRCMCYTCTHIERAT